MNDPSLTMTLTFAELDRFWQALQALRTYHFMIPHASLQPLTWDISMLIGPHAEFVSRRLSIESEFTDATERASALKKLDGEHRTLRLRRFAILPPDPMNYPEALPTGIAFTIADLRQLLITTEDGVNFGE